MHDPRPVAVRRSLQKFAAYLGIARRKRRLTAATMAERIGVAASTYARMEKGAWLAAPHGFAIEPGL